MMQHSDTIDKFAAAMAKVQAEIGKAIKDAENPAFKRGNKASTYADLSAVWDAWQPIGPANGFAVMQFPGIYDPEARTMEMHQLVTHSSGQWVRGDMSIPLSKVDAQGYGSALTYVRRYALSAAVGICPEDDDGNAASKSAPANQNGSALKQQLQESVRQAEPVTDAQRDIIQTLAPAAGKSVQDICKAYRVESLKGLTEAQAVKLIERLRADAKEPINA